MTLRSRFDRLLFLALLASLPAANVFANEAPTAAKTSWEELLRWLPEDTETIMVAQGAIAIPKKEADRFQFAEALSLLPAGPTFSFAKELLHKELQGQKVLMAMEGSRRFTSPKNLGMMPYEGCHILQFESDDVVRQAFKVCQDKAEKKIELAGVQVAVFSEKMEEDVWSIFICRPRAGVLMCATDKAYLETTLKRMNGKAEKRALPAELPEWKHVDRKAKIWGVRHYRKEFAKTDPSSPLRPRAAANVPDPTAVGFVFWYSPGAENMIRARYLSQAKDAVEIAAKGWNHPSEKLEPTIKRADAGVVEISESLAEDRTAHMFLFVLLGYLGHGIYL
jgi:hypothetical protein